ncbi:MAG: carbon-nitrogen family hydrolase [Desulfobacterales bacterium]|nr:carbon-nitrogen family hydrolase [Desulfobacterales bacterium]
MRVASIQMSVVEGDKEKTIAKALENIRLAAGADLVILPEIWNIGFMSFDRYESEAEDREGPTLTALRQAAARAGVYLHTGSFVEKEGDNYYNSSYLLSPGGDILANYRKIHLFGHNSRETQLLTPGEKVVVADTPLGAIGLATCYDLRFPELFRRMAEQGAKLFLICSAWPYPRLEHWIIFNRARALENQCFLVSANSVGPNLGATFVGHSMMVNPWGVILASGGDEEVIIRSEIDPTEVDSARERFSAYNDRVSWLS